MTEILGDLLVSAQEAAHARLRELIFSGALQAGQALRQEEIARQLGLSRLPVREALNRLATEGLVELKPRRGFYVVSLKPDEIEDIFEMRAMLEARAGQLATERMTTLDADALDRLVASLDAAVNGNEALDDYSRLNEQFHERLYQSCNRKYLRRQIGMLRDAVAPLIRILAAETGELRRAQEEHRQMARLFRLGDAPRVAELCRKHCAYTGTALIEKFLKTGSSALDPSNSSKRRGSPPGTQEIENQSSVANAD
jgi:DNA-binding GntR family transcriptional regulator